MLTMTPGKRKLTTEYEKTIIIVNGKSEIGKSTLCDLLLNDDINYISIDVASIRTDHNIKEIIEFVDKYKELSVMRIHWLTPIISKTCYKEFIDYFFEKYIVKNENLNILIDGILFTHDHIYEYFLEKCKSSEFRVWEIKRIF